MGGMVSTNLIIRCLMAMLVQDQNNFLIDVEKNQLKSNLSKDLEAYRQLN